MDSDFLKQKNKQTNAPIYLYTIYDYDGASNNLTFAEWSEDILFDSITYQKFPISHDEIGDNSQGQTPFLKVRISNISRLIQYYLETYDWRGKKVKVTLVWLDNLDNPDCKFDFTFFIDSYVVNEKVAEFNLLPKVDALGITLPRRTYSRNYCQWRFKSVECGYAGAETKCSKTKQRCKVLDNYTRYGGFPAIPTKRLYV